MTTNQHKNKNYTIHPFVRWVAIIGGTAVATINVSKLLPVNPEYGAAWWKAALAAGIVLFAAKFHK